MDGYSVATPIGEFAVAELFFYYDRPRIFSCVNKVGALFLGFLAEESPKTDRWFFVPISKSRLSLLRGRKISVRLAITDAEEGWLWQIILPLTNKREGTCEIVRTVQISDDDLPDDDSFIDSQIFEYPHEATIFPEIPISTRETAEETEVYGMLVHIDTTHNTFAIKEDTGQYLCGSLSDNVKECVFRVPEKVRALIQSTIEINPQTKRQVTMYKLKRVEPICELGGNGPEA